MPITRSAKKALRQSERRREQNLLRKEAFKQVIKEIRIFVQEKKIGDAEALLTKAYKMLDKAAKSGVIKKNSASRKKSRLARLINKGKRQS